MLNWVFGSIAATEKITKYILRKQLDVGQN